MSSRDDGKMSVVTVSMLIVVTTFGLVLFLGPHLVALALRDRAPALRQAMPELARAIVTTWLDTPFEGGRHIRRIEKLDTPAGS